MAPLRSLRPVASFPGRRPRRLAATAAAGWLIASLAGAQPPHPAWHGHGCVPAGDLARIVDQAFAATPAAELFPERGSGAAGYSVAVSRPGCGRFLYAVGLRDVRQGRPVTRRTRQHVGSLTKSVTATLVLRLATRGAFGADGLETTVDRLLDPSELAALSVGEDPAAPRCPADVLTLNRLTFELEPARALCPDFSTITLRHLLNGNHGLFDFINEVDRNGNGIFDANEPVLGALFDALGVPRLSLPPGTDTPFELLTAFGLLANPAATIGGTGSVDFEVSFGNTGYALLGVIAERVSGLTYNQLLSLGVDLPPGSPRMLSLTAPPARRKQISRQYLVTSGAGGQGLPEDLFGLYPLLDVAGHPAIDVYDLGGFIVTGGGGGGSVVASPDAYRAFFRGLLEGGQLDAREQALFDGGFVGVDELPGVFHGFGLFRFDDPEFGPGFAKSGQVPGSACQALHFTDRGVTAVACRNSVDAFLGGATPNSATPVGDLARDLVRVASSGPG